MELRPLSSDLNWSGMHWLQTKYAMSAWKKRSRQVVSVHDWQISESQISHVKSAPSQFFKHFWQPFGEHCVIQSEQLPILVSNCSPQVGHSVPPGESELAGHLIFCFVKRVLLPQLMHRCSSTAGLPGRFGPMMWVCRSAIA